MSYIIGMSTPETAARGITGQWGIIGIIIGVLLVLVWLKKVFG